MELIYLDESQWRELTPIPVLKTGYWGSTMEACLLTGQQGKAVRSVFKTFPEYIQQALTFTPESGWWVDRARFWQVALRFQLPPKQYHEIIQKFMNWYARCVRLRQECPAKIRKQDFSRIAGEILCECYRWALMGGGRYDNAPTHRPLVLCPGRAPVGH